MTRFLPLAAALLCTAFFVSGCALFGPTVDELALFEPAQLAWPDVWGDLEEGYTDGEAAGDLTAEAAGVLRAASVDMGKALNAKSVDDLRAVPWNTMEPWAYRGIDARLAREEIGPGVADSFRVNVGQFSRAVHRLVGVR